MNEKMYKAFGVILLNSEGGDREEAWCRRWARAVHFKYQQYNLPGGTVGREFFSLLTENIRRPSRSEEKSERFIVFMPWQQMCLKQAWRTNQIVELIYEAERCDHQLPKHQQGKQDGDHTIRVFTRSVLKGQIRSAVRWMKGRMSYVVAFWILPPNYTPQAKMSWTY